MVYEDKNVTMEDVRLIFRNFGGKGSQFNKEGDMNFCVILDHKVAAAMAKDGWNVKMPKPTEEGDERDPFLKIIVKYRNIKGDLIKPPKIVMVSSKGKTHLGEKEVNVLDWVDIETVDLIIRPNNYDINGKQGVSAYLQTMYVTIREDALELKYADIDPQNDEHKDLEFQ